MAIIKEEYIDNKDIKYKWKITLSNGVVGKQIELDGVLTKYIITKKGKVYNIETEEMKKIYIPPNGYKTTHIKSEKTGKSNTLSIHRLIALGWIPNPENKPIINHIDGNKLNLKLKNLEWCTYSENNKHAFDTGLKKPSRVASEKCNLTKHSVEQVISVCEYLQIGYTPKAIHNIFNIDYDFAQKIYRRITWKHISCEYNFDKVIMYHKNFSLDEITKIKKLYDQGFKVKEITVIMNWEYTEKLRGNIRQLIRQIKRYEHREVQEKLL